MKKVTDFLFSHIDQEYQKFVSALIPNVDSSFVLGVRTPLLKKEAKLMNPDERDIFLKELPHQYLEEYSFHRSLIERIKDYPRMIIELNAWLPYITNWSNCDGFRNPIILKHKADFFTWIKKWLSSPLTYTKRFAVNMLMSYCLDEDFMPEYLSSASGVDEENNYYLQMVVAFYLATAFAKHYEVTLTEFKKMALTTFAWNKTLQKARESYRISEEQKAELLLLKKK